MNDETRLRRAVVNKVNIRKLLMLVSFSIFSLIFSTSSNCPSFLKPYNFYIFTFPIRLITHTIDKSCIFLLCNGILVFLAKTSGLIKGSTFRSPKKNKEIIITHPSPHQQYHIKLDHNDEYTMEQKEEEEETTSMAEDTDEHEHQENELIGDSVKETHQVDNGDLKQGSYQLYEEEDDDVWNTPMSTDELNKKFDEFIRKMKEEIKVEDQQNLVVVK